MYFIYMAMEILPTYTYLPALAQMEECRIAPTAKSLVAGSNPAGRGMGAIAFMCMLALGKE